jgi:adenylate cyclase
MTEKRARRKLSGILSADAVGYSRLMRENEAATILALAESKELMSRLIQQFRGQVVDAPGDNLLAEFASVVDAVECAVEIQRELKAKNANVLENRRMEFRIGINLGDVIEEKERIYGDGVNVAARIEGLADAGGICISRTAFDQVKEKLKLGYQYLGEHSVKNIAEPVRVYRVLMEADDIGKVIGEKKPKSSHWRWVAIGGVLVLILVAGALAVWNFYFRPAYEPVSVEKMAFPLPDKPSIAVLPFDNLSGDPSQEWFCDGLTEEIISAISRVENLFVIARNSTFTYKGKPVNVQKVAADLGIRYVLEGSVRQEGNRVRVTAQLIDAVTGHHMFSERYDRDLKGIFALQDDIAIKTLTAVRAALTGGEMARLQARGVSNIDAYFKLLEATEIANRVNKESNIQARRLAEEALQIEPESARAYYILAVTHMFDFWLGPPKSPGESIVQGIKSARKAIELDEFNPYSHGILGILYVNKGDYDKAVEEGQRAASLGPNSAGALFFYGSSLMHASRYEEAIPVLEKALRLSPVKPVSMNLMNLGVCYRMVGSYDDAVRILKRLLQEQPNHFLGHLILTQTYSEMGHMEEARAQAAKVLKMNPRFSLKSWARISRLKNPADVQRGIEALRKAGLPD